MMSDKPKPAFAYTTTTQAGTGKVRIWVNEKPPAEIEAAFERQVKLIREQKKGRQG
jgi:hypothetical protein